MHHLLHRTDAMKKDRSLAQSLFDRVVLRHPKIVIACLAAVIVFFGLGVRRFRLDASTETLMLENDQDLKYSRLIDSRYGSGDFLILTFTPKEDLLSDGTLALLARLRDDLKRLHVAESVLTILDVPLLESPPIPLKELGSTTRTLESPDVDKTLARKELTQSPLYQDLLVSRDLKTTAILITFPRDYRWASPRATKKRPA